MRNILPFLIITLLFNMNLAAAEDWGETGHRAVGEIATNHLTRKAKKAINKLLDGQSLAFVSTYADEIRSDKTMPNYGPWHYVNFPFGETYEVHPKSEKGDLIKAINDCIGVLKNETKTKEEKAFHLKMLVHFIGDLHQPLHVGIADDRGGNRFQVQWFGEGTNLHSVWDYEVIESYNMSYTELVDNVDPISTTAVVEIQKGPITKWMYESRVLCEDIYANTESGENLRFEYRYKYVPVIRKQIHKGGIRLAGILNEIFG